MLLGPINYEIIMIFILLGVLASTFSHKINVPYTTTLLILGMFITFLNIKLNFALQVSSLTHLLSAELFFNLILPPIIFKATLDLDYNRFLDNLWPIVYLATVGVLISVIMISVLIHFFLKLSWYYSALFATIISPTDPVGVIATLKHTKVVPNTTSLIEGEALINDATAITIFSVLLTFRTSFFLVNFFKVILMVFIASPLIGFAFGYFSNKLITLISGMETRISLIFVMSYLSFFVTQALGGSGIISEIITGFMISTNLGSFKNEVNNFWSVIDYIVTSLLFISMGIVFNPFLIINYFVIIIISFIIVFTSRIAIIRSLRFFKDVQYDYQLAFLAGIRGAIPLVLALNLPPLISKGINYTNLIIAMTIGVASISLIVQTALAQKRIAKLSSSEMLEANF
jgi:CPA1 family monovalent cation:H+ antiporter